MVLPMNADTTRRIDLMRKIQTKSEAISGFVRYQTARTQIECVREIEDWAAVQERGKIGIG